MKSTAPKDEKAIPGTPNDASRRNFFKTVGAATVGGLTLAVTPGCDTGTEDCDLPDGGTIVREADCGNFASLTGNPASESYWRKVRKQFILPDDIVYLNTGTEGSMPCFLLDNIKSDLENFAARPMDTILYDDRCSLFLTSVRQKVADFMGAGLGEIVLTNNTTEGLGWVSNGLDLAEGDEIVTTVHFEPYNSCLKFLRDRKKITLTEIDLPTPATSKQEIIDAFADAITPGTTKLLCFCHINYATGLRMPVKEICELAQANDIITLVDAAHAIGQIDVDVRDLGVDFYATSPHKWLCAPPGTGVLYMRDGMQKLVWPTVTEIYLAKADSPITTKYFSVRGQQCTPAYGGIIDAIDFQTAIGKETIEQRLLSMSAYAKEKVIDNWGEQSLFSPVEEELSTGMVAFSPFDSDVKGGISKLFSGLWDKNIITRSIYFKLKSADESTSSLLRICPHLYNNYDHIDRTFEEIESIIASL
ncbi:MAG: aminotransferase class V-fold PLP-dependent enzyme [Proteobacteria bacterium]|nr:aminotransferase class V-fold PLP-dependent enzyme [Pseudomonadota bacterium]